MVYGRDPDDISKEMRVEYEKRFESVKRWKSNLASKSDHTFYGYLGDLIRFCRDVNMTPDELIGLRSETLNSKDPIVQHKIEEMIQSYVNNYAKTKSVSKAKYIRNALGSFFRHNYYRLGTIKISEVAEREEQIKVLKPQDLREVLKRCNIRERSIILTIESGGFREGTLVKLKLINIDQDDLEFVFEGEKILDVKIKRSPVHIHVPKKTNKGKRNSYNTFISSEAAKELVKRLKQRIEYGEHLTLKSFLYINSKRLKKTGIQLKPSAIYHLVKRAGERVGLKLMPSDLRDYFSSKLEKTKEIPFSAIEQMMGHLSFFSTSAGSYKQFSVDELREFYCRAEPFLVIEEPLPIVEEEQRKRDLEMDVLREQIKKLETNHNRLRKVFVKVLERYEPYKKIVEKVDSLPEEDRKIAEKTIKQVADRILNELWQKRNNKEEVFVS